MLPMPRPHRQPKWFPSSRRGTHSFVGVVCPCGLGRFSKICDTMLFISDHRSWRCLTYRKIDTTFWHSNRLTCLIRCRCLLISRASTSAESHTRGSPCGSPNPTSSLATTTSRLAIYSGSSPPVSILSCELVSVPKVRKPTEPTSTSLPTRLTLLDTYGVQRSYHTVPPHFYRTPSSTPS